MASKNTNGRYMKWIFFVVGLLSVITGCVLVRFNVFGNLLRREIDCKVILKQGSDSFKSWESPSDPAYFQVWMFHVANPAEVVQSGAKPVLIQKGPYTYREKKKKVNIRYEDGNKTISYREKKWYVFDQAMSVGPQTDRFTTVNLPLITVANMMRFEDIWVKDVFSFLLREVGERLFISLTVGDLLWGYEDRLLHDLKEMMTRYGIKFPIDDNFGLFYKRNGSDDGVYRIQTGLGGTVHHFAEIISWNGNSSLSYWSSAWANSLNGSDGTLYPPFVDNSRPLYLFSSDLCRSLEIRYTEGYGLKGINVDRFTVPPLTFANVSVNPANRGFCTPSTNCLPAGLLNVSVCRDGIPVVMSLPHFLDGDPDLRTDVVGMNPSRRQHQSVVDIEAMTGLVVNAAKRLQLNAYLTNTSLIKETMFLRDDLVLPVLWLNESITVNNKTASELRKEKEKMLLLMEVAEVAQYGLIFCGAFLLLCSVVGGLKEVVQSPRSREPKVFGKKSPILASP